MGTRAVYTFIDASQTSFGLQALGRPPPPRPAALSPTPSSWPGRCRVCLRLTSARRPPSWPPTSRRWATSVSPQAPMPTATCPSPTRSAAQTGDSTFASPDAPARCPRSSMARSKTPNNLQQPSTERNPTMKLKNITITHPPQRHLRATLRRPVLFEDRGPGGQPQGRRSLRGAALLCGVSTCGRSSPPATSHSAPTPGEGTITSPRLRNGLSSITIASNFRRQP